MYQDYLKIDRKFLCAFAKSKAAVLVQGDLINICAIYHWSNLVFV